MTWVNIEDLPPDTPQLALVSQLVRWINADALPRVRGDHTDVLGALMTVYRALAMHHACSLPHSAAGVDELARELRAAVAAQRLAQAAIARAAGGTAPVDEPATVHAAAQVQLGVALVRAITAHALPPGATLDVLHQIYRDTLLANPPLWQGAENAARYLQQQLDARRPAGQAAVPRSQPRAGRLRGLVRAVVARLQRAAH